LFRKYFVRSIFEDVAYTMVTVDSCNYSHLTSAF
jgi:hypothetical protein